jgi:hypothetical protein
VKFVLLFVAVLLVAFVFLRGFTKQERRLVLHGLRQALVPTLIAVAAVVAALVIGFSPTIKVI